MLHPRREAARITQMLDIVLGADRFDRAPVDIAVLAVEYSKQISPDGPIHQVVGEDLPGCVGALVCSETEPRQWAIMYHRPQSTGRRAFTIGHEFGHFILHRHQMSEGKPKKFLCSEGDVFRRGGAGIEKEADEFAADLLMPLHDFRRQLPPDQKANFDVLGRLADRYGVSLTAVILRWLEYTEIRALAVLSNEGFAHWATASQPAFKSGRFIRTKHHLFELPPASAAVLGDFSEESRNGKVQNAGIWFPEPVLEMCIRSDRYDNEITLLQLDGLSRAETDSPREIDTFDFMNRACDQH